MLVPRALLTHISTLEFLRTFEKRERYSPTARASLGTSPCSQKFLRAYITQQCTRRVYYPLLKPILT